MHSALVRKVPGGHSLVQERPHDSDALCVGLVHQGIEVGQQGVSGLQHTFWNSHKGSIPGHRVLSLKGEKDCSAFCKGEMTKLRVSVHTLHMAHT